MKEFQVTIKSVDSEQVVNINADTRVDAIREAVKKAGINVDELDNYDFSVMKASDVKQIKKKVKEEVKNEVELPPHRMSVYCPKCGKDLKRPLVKKSMKCILCGYNDHVNKFLGYRPNFDKQSEYATWTKEEMIEFVQDIECWSDDDEKVIALQAKTRDELIEICENIGDE
jgi:hypothetical protein